MSEMKIPQKPKDVSWTHDQWKAIMAKGQDILVAAAAGSGKTAVLVERMITRILSDPSFHVDEWLVVTFTNASAAEMRHRIGEALEKAIKENPSSQHLRKQLTLLNRASISTLHSFCLEVIRKYYYLIDIDPGFRIADATEAQLLRDEAMDEIFEEEYGKEGNGRFFDLVDTFTNDRSDVALQDIVQKLYDFSQSHPDPVSYLQSIINMYDVREDAPIDALPFIDALLEDVELQLEGAKELLENGLDITRQPFGPAPREENFLSDIQIVDTLLQAKQDSWSTLYEAMQVWSFARAKTCRGDQFDKVLIDQAQKKREKAKYIIKSIQEELFSRRPESFMKDMREMKENIETLVQLVQSFANRFQEMKTEKGLVDFADLEHLCLQILMDQTTNKQEGPVPSDAALSYRAQFKEVLVDEYQDVNMVQEYILQLVTKGEGKNGNLFMVGDVKQSIYRFRLAEPKLFLGKYHQFTHDGEVSGLKIDLARNFRSRKEILYGTNYIFKQIMGVKIGEIEYDASAELVPGASYPENVKEPVELILIDHDTNGLDREEAEEDDSIEYDPIELEQSVLEARWMAQKVKELISSRASVYQAKTKTSRPIMYRDIVILLRSMTWAPQIIEEFKQQGIPIYANLSTGYFEASEISTMMALLKVIDNPYQDIPLAAVLRSPIIGLNEEELANLRIHHKNGSFYEALTSYGEKGDDSAELYEKLTMFYHSLKGWRSQARKGFLSELIWQLYRDTHFYDFVGGLPGGKQRQANLRALYDRARQYETTSFRGLFRFLRFIERMRERGDDLGAARALGEQEDVVRIMTIHSSKGLEFPAVFIAGLGRSFNMMDMRKSYLFDKEWGFATRYVNSKNRVTLPSLPQLALKRKKKLEMLAEEMRILYVALTRAKEKLFLIGSVKKAEKMIQQWESELDNPKWLLKEYERASASTYLDWIGPALIRHEDSEKLRLEGKGIYGLPADITKHPSSWDIQIIPANEISSNDQLEQNETEDYLKYVYNGEKVPIESKYKDTIYQQLSWEYRFQAAETHRSKQSVSEMKRQREVTDENSGAELISTFSKPFFNRPKFMQAKKLTPAEKGTAMHLVMQHLDVKKPLTVDHIQDQLDELISKELLTEEQRMVIDPTVIIEFFDSEIGKRLMNAKKIDKEIPFSFSYPASKAYSDWRGEEEAVLIQGIVDCFFEDEKGTVLLDYKTDTITGRYKGGFTEAQRILESKYRVQMDLYAEAIENITKRKVDECYLFFFDGSHLLPLTRV
ncbi:helicase-exonuclease AddAB subunit AddA [Bacillus sp. 03113]|uniref:helicase-exonuclease AddAB subunit AddA n=1 Tax=Bacillus sp. 03113 TaxID=2578211 RepID=UPI00114329E2|nr:helicase-exonuclease AddAB subunit AddA [Bacillus sp. 03113]